MDENPTPEERAQMNAWKAEEAAKPVFDGIERFTNTMGNKPEFAALVNMITHRMHRYLQQEFFNLFIIPLIKTWAEDYKTDRFDARNEYAVKMSALIVERLSKEIYFG